MFFPVRVSVRRRRRCRLSPCTVICSRRCRLLYRSARALAIPVRPGLGSFSLPLPRRPFWVCWESFSGSINSGAWLAGAFGIPAPSRLGRFASRLNRISGCCTFPSSGAGSFVGWGTSGNWVSLITGARGFFSRGLDGSPGSSLSSDLPAVMPLILLSPMGSMSSRDNGAGSSGETFSTSSSTALAGSSGAVSLSAGLRASGAVDGLRVVTTLMLPRSVGSGRAIEGGGSLLAWLSPSAMKCLILSTSSSSRLARAEPLPAMPAFLTISTNSLLSRPRSFAREYIRVAMFRLLLLSPAMDPIWMGPGT